MEAPAGEEVLGLKGGISSSSSSWNLAPRLEKIGAFPPV